MTSLFDPCSPVSIIGFIMMAIAAVPVGWVIAQCIKFGARFGGNGGVGLIRGAQAVSVLTLAYCLWQVFTLPAPAACAADVEAGTPSISIPIVLAGLVVLAVGGCWVLYRLTRPNVEAEVREVAPVALQRAKTIIAERAVIADQLAYDAAFRGIVAAEATPATPDIEAIRTTVANILALAAVDQGLNPHEIIEQIDARTEVVMRELLGANYTAGTNAINATGITLAIAAATARKATVK